MSTRTQLTIYPSEQTKKWVAQQARKYGVSVSSFLGGLIAHAKKVRPQLESFFSKSTRK